jgi:GT2 family glycosyltransferase
VSETPRISVIIPAYRAAGTIGRTLDGLLAQTRPADEILVIDDGSPDDLAAALAPYGERVRLVRQSNGGAASARNRGIDLARGDWIAFVDADDYWERQKLERQLAVATRHPDVGLIASHFYQQRPGQPRYTHELLRPYYDRVLTIRGADILTMARRIWTSTVLVRRSALGEQRFDTALATAEDVDLWIRLIQAAPVYLVAEPLATAVLVAGSLSRSDVAADAFNMLTVVRRHAAMLGTDGVRAGTAQIYREWAAGHLGNHEPRAALVPAWRRLLHQPGSLQAWWVLLKAAAWAAAQKRAGAKPRSAAPGGLGRTFSETRA